MNRFIIGSFLIAVGILISATGVGLADIGGTGYKDTYPDNQTWGQFGTHDNTKTDVDGYLTLQDNTNTGTYTSDAFDPSGTITIETVIYEVSNLQQNQKLANLTIQGLDNNSAVVDSYEVKAKNGKYSANLGNFSNNEFDQYRFKVFMEDTQGTTSDKPVFEYLSVAGVQTDPEPSEGLETIMSLFFMAIGLLVIIDVI